MKLKDMIICAVFAAVIGVMSQLVLPIGVIPFSMGIFAVMLCAIILGWKKSMISVGIFILIGAVGIPVFAGMKGGFPVLIGPTGGYITGYILMSGIIGFVSEKVSQNDYKSLLIIFGTTIFGTGVCYIIGTLQFMFVANKDLISALKLCVIPFIVPDLIKCAVATIVGSRLKHIKFNK